VTPPSPVFAFDEVLKKSRADVLNTLVEVELQPASPSARQINAVGTADLDPLTAIPRSTCEATFPFSL
jgi:hypothetical protein